MERVQEHRSRIAPGSPASRPRQAHRPDQRGLLRLQRLAGNAAVVRLVGAARPTVQRDLVITGVSADDKKPGPDQEFTDPLRAEAYLKQEYRKQYHKDADAKAADRLLELAKVALNSNEIVTVDLGKALGYIHAGTPAQAQHGYRDPSRSPTRPPPPAWNYDYLTTGAVPLQAPQSPRSHYPDVPRTPLSIDVPAHLGSMASANTQKRTAHPDYEFGKNLFTYRVDATLRLTPLSKITGPRGAYYLRAQAQSGSGRATSRTYQSKMEMPPLGPSAPAPVPFSKETSMRQELDRITTRGRADQTAPFYTESSLYTFDRSRNRTGVDRRNNYFQDTARASRNAISSLYIHSEVQAAADAHDGAGRDLAQQLFDNITAAARAARDSAQEGLEVVIVAITWAGDSDPNTVCGNACKGALVHLGEIIDGQLDAHRAQYKARLAGESIFLRGSAQYSVSGHVQGHRKFGTPGKAARKPGGGPLRGQISDRVVREHWTG